MNDGFFLNDQSLVVSSGDRIGMLKYYVLTSPVLWRNIRLMHSFAMIARCVFLLIQSKKYISWICARRLNDSTVYAQDLAIDPASVGLRQESDRGGYVLRLP